MRHQASANRVTLGQMSGAHGSARLLIFGWLAASVLLTISQLRHPDDVLGDVLYLAVAAAASIAAWIGVRWCRGRGRPVGALLAAAITVSLLGDVTSIGIGWRAGAEPQASAADLGWIATYVLLGAALLLLLRRHDDPDQRRDIDGLIDVAAVTVAGMFVIWALAVEATFADATLPVAVRLLWGLYPVMDLAILALVLRILIRYRSPVAMLVACGIGLWFAADVAYLAIADAASYSALLDAAWLWGMIFMALAVMRGGAMTARWGAGRRQPAVDETGLGRISLALLPLLIPGLVELQWFLRGHDATPAVTIPGTMVLLALAFVRMARLASTARSARQALASQERYASALAANSSDAVAVLDADRRPIGDVSPLAELLERPADTVRQRDLLSLVVPEDREAAGATVRRCLSRPGEVFHLEVRFGDGHGRPAWLGVRMVNLLADPDVAGIVVNLHDISDRKRAEEDLSHQAFHDALTGLANRALFRDRLDHALERGAGAAAEPAVIFLDLDGFKAVNDRLGHDRGDDLLREIASRLTAIAGRGETVGRLGGDEFAVLIEKGEPPLAEAKATAERLLSALREPVWLGDQPVRVSASVGIAVGDGINSSSRLLRNADVAMYRSKATGKDRLTAYRPGMRTAARERQEWETAMRVALERDEYHLVYQPVVDLRRQRLVGFEALLRWQRPDYGLLTPDAFIPLAEETGLIVPIGRRILQEAVHTAARWQPLSRRGEPLTIAVNISGRQLADPDLVNEVRGALTATRLDPGSLVLEITETALVDDAPAVAARLRSLRKLGVRLAIDDFGIGYSSLSYLRHFPFDILKIDRSFVHAIPEHGEFPPILRSLLDLGHTLGLRTLAEGVERDFQRRRLRDAHCDLAQGYLIARPMSRSDAEELLARSAPRSGIATASP
jgi:diguanylate cyclase (GGDEF)-like protein/PAS domain S-box-containing protein